MVDAGEAPSQESAPPVQEKEQEATLTAMNGDVNEELRTNAPGESATKSSTPVDEKKVDTEAVDLLGLPHPEPPNQPEQKPAAQEIDLLGFSAQQEQPQETAAAPPNLINGVAETPSEAVAPPQESPLLDFINTEVPQNEVSTPPTEERAESPVEMPAAEPKQEANPVESTTIASVEPLEAGGTNAVEEKQQPDDTAPMATEETAAIPKQEESSEESPVKSDEAKEKEAIVAEETIVELQQKVVSEATGEESEPSEGQQEQKPATEPEANGESSKETENKIDSAVPDKEEQTQGEWASEEIQDADAKPPPKEDSPAVVEKEAEPPTQSVSDETAELIAQLQASLDDQMQQRKDAEKRAEAAEDRVRQCEEQLVDMSRLEEEVEKLNENIEELVSEKSHMEFELNTMEQSRDEHERKANVLSNRLNAAKKKEGIKANIAEQLEDENKELQAQLTTTQKELIIVTAEKEGLELEMEALKKKCVDRVKGAETSLEDEQRLNEERKKKMKLYIETKAEELRVAKAHNDELKVEVEQTQISLRETNDRWKQLHAQWVQSQTRNRELQRDLNRIKKDSDHLHKIGDNLEMKLNRSAQETEEHKNKRLTAKHELMTILRTLEAERSVSGKLRDSIKFTFTPKALSQQQLLKESLQDFEAELMKLSRRLGKPLPPPPLNASNQFHDDVISTPIESEAENDAADDGEPDDETGTNGGSSKRNRSEIDSNHLLSNLENETQLVSQSIMALISNIERMNVMLQEGDRSCFTLLTDLLTGAQQATANGAHDETTSMTGSGASARNRLGGPYSSVPHG